MFGIESFLGFTRGDTDVETQQENEMTAPTNNPENRRKVSRVAKVPLRDSYLSAVDSVTKTWHNDLKTTTSQLAARHSLVEAIGAVRGTLDVMKNVGPDFGHGFKWNRGAVCPDGRVFFAPHGAEHVLCVDPFDGSISPFGDPIASSKLATMTTHDRKYSDAVFSPRGSHLYLVPASGRSVLKLDLALGTWATVGGDLGGGDWKWGGGVLHGHRIYCAPHNSKQVLVIDCKRDTVELVGDDLGIQNAKWGSPVIVPMKYHTSFDSHVPLSTLRASQIVILFPPLNAPQVLLLNPQTHQTALMGKDFGTDHFKYDGGCLGFDGAVYCAPSCAAQFLRIDVLFESSGQEPELGSPKAHDNASSALPGWKQSVHRMMRQHSIGDNPVLGSGKDQLAHLVVNTVNSKPAPKKSHSPRAIVPSTSVILNSKPALLPTHSSYKWPPEIKCSYHGQERAGNFKFGSTVMSADGKTAIAVPMNFGAFLSIDTRMKDGKAPIHRMGSKLVPENLRFGGGVVGVDGYLYCAPLQATRVMRVDTIALSRHHYERNHDLLNHTKTSSHSLRNLKPLASKPQLFSSIKEKGEKTYLGGNMNHLASMKNVRHNMKANRPVMKDEEDADFGISNFVGTSLNYCYAPIMAWQPTSDAVFNNYITKKASNKRFETIREVSIETVDDDEYSSDDDNDNDFAEMDETKPIPHKEPPSLKLSPWRAMIVIAAYVHWRKFAAQKAKEKNGFSASERLVGNNDKQMRALLLLEPEIWCYGLTLKNSSIPDDLCDWLEIYFETDVGVEFVSTCGLEANNEAIINVAKTPNLAYSLITLEKNEILMKLPIIRRAIMKPYVFEGDWLVQCLSNRKHSEAAVSFIELVSKDIEQHHIAHIHQVLEKKKKSQLRNLVNNLNNDHPNSPKHNNDSNKDTEKEDVVDEEDEDNVQLYAKNKTFVEIAAINHFVSPMLRLPTHLQDRVASTELMRAVLDELFTERPLSLLMICFDFSTIFVLLLLLIKATWEVQHEGHLEEDQIFVNVAIVAVNFVYIFRRYINWKAFRKLGLEIEFSKVLDVLTICALFAIVAMSFFPVRLKPIFLVVASATSGLCWLKLLGFLSSIHLQFAVYIEALKLITKGLRIYILTLFVFMTMFLNMFYVVMNNTGYYKDDEEQAEEEEEEEEGGIYDQTFTHIQTSFLTLFRMLLGDFEMEWFHKPGEPLLTLAAYVLFVIYMFGVFIIMLNVLIAVVCDNYSFAMSKGHEIFLRTRLQTVANLDMQGITKLRNISIDSALSKGNISSFSSPNSNSEIHHQNSYVVSLKDDGDDQMKRCFHVYRVIDYFANKLDLLLKDSLWHFYMKNFLAIKTQTKHFSEVVGKFSESSEDIEITQDSLNHRANTEIIASMEKRISRIEEQQMLSESRIVQTMQSLEAKIMGHFNKKKPLGSKV